MSELFSVPDHFAYLQTKFRRSGEARGIKGRFAQHVRIQPAFLSQVLARKYPLSLEQADLANSFFGHSLDESEYFILLVSRDRAGSTSLQKHFNQKLENLRGKRLDVVERLGKKAFVSGETQGIYYSSWMYGAVHVATTIPSLRKVGAIQDYLGIPREKILRILQFLETHGLLLRKGDEFFPTKTWLRLGRQSPHIDQFHTHWRQRAIQALTQTYDEDLHFSGVYSLDSKTATTIREALLECIEEQAKRIETAPEKDLFALNLDFYQLVRK